MLKANPLNIPTRPLFRALPVPVAYAAATAGARWTGSVVMPNDGKWFLVGVAVAAPLGRVNSVDSIGAGDGNIIQGDGFILDAIAQPNVTAFQLFPGPIPVPGIPGQRFCGLGITFNGKLTLSGLLEVAGAGNQMSSNAQQADLSVLLADQSLMPAEMQGFRPSLINLPCTTAAATGSGTEQQILSSQYGGPLTYTKINFRRTNVEAGSQATLSMTRTFRLNITPGNRSPLRQPWTGRVPAVVLGGTEASVVAGMPAPLLRFDLENGETIEADWLETAAGTTDEVRTDVVLAGYETLPKGR